MMNAPMSGKQKRESMKFLFDELRKNSAYTKEQKRKEQAHAQQMAHKDESHSAKLEVPPKRFMPMGMPMNPEAGPNDKIPALLSKGEAVIPSKAAQDPMNKPLIKAMVREGRSDRNLSVPMPKGFNYGTTNVQGYFNGTEGVGLEPMGDYSGATAADVVSLEEQNNYRNLLNQLAGSTNQGQQTNFNVPPLLSSNLIVPQSGVQVAEAPVPPPSGKASAQKNAFNFLDSIIKTITPDVVPNTNTASGGSTSSQKIVDPAAKNIIDTSVKPDPNAIFPGKTDNRAQIIVTDAPLSIAKTEENLLLNDQLAYQRWMESRGNYEIGYHPNSKAYGAYGIMPATYETIQANDPYFKGKSIESLTPEEQDRAFLSAQSGYKKRLEQLKIEPTDANLRLSAFLGADGAAKYLADGTISKEAQNANGGEKKAKAIAEQRLAGPAGNSEYLKSLKTSNTPVNTNVVSVTADGKATPPQPTMAINTNVPPMEKSKEISPEDFAMLQERSKEIDPMLRTTTTAERDTRKPFEKWTDAISSTLKDAYNTLKDPVELKSAAKSALETLGFNAQDATRFGALVAASKALGYNNVQAVRYAGNYALQSSDRRAALEAQMSRQDKQLQYAELAADRRYSEGYDKQLRGQQFSEYQQNARASDSSVKSLEDKGWVITNKRKQSDGSYIFDKSPGEWTALEGAKPSFEMYRNGALKGVQVPFLSLELKGPGTKVQGLKLPTGGIITRAQIDEINRTGDPKQVAAVKALLSGSTSTPLASTDNPDSIEDRIYTRTRQENQDFDANQTKLENRIKDRFAEIVGNPTSKDKANEAYANFPDNVKLARQITNSIRDTIGLDLYDRKNRDLERQLKIQDTK